MQNSAGQPVSRMFVPRTAFDDRKNYYLDKKYPALTQLIKKNETISLDYPVEAFGNLLDHALQADGFRVYYASYSAEGEKEVPTGYGDMLTVIFAPVKKDGTDYVDTGAYYTITPEGLLTELKVEIKDQWITNYLDIKWPVLEKIIGKPETKSTRFDHSALKEFKQLIGAYLPEATGVRHYMASYIGDDPNNPADKQLIPEFIFSDIQGNDIYIYMNRVTPSTAMAASRDGGGSGGLNTSTPSPPA